MSAHKLVFTNGCFDILHAGHVWLLEKAGSYGDSLIVGLNSDSSARALKGVGRPIVGQEDRKAVLLALRCVDGVWVFNEADCSELIRRLAPAVYVKAIEGDLPETERRALEECGSGIVLLGLRPGFLREES